MTQETNIWLMDNSWMRGWFMDDSWVFPVGKPATKTYTATVGDGYHRPSHLRVLRPCRHGVTNRHGLHQKYHSTIHWDETMVIYHGCPMGTSMAGWWFFGKNPSWKMMEFVNWDDESNPIFMGKCQKWQPNHQPDGNIYWESIVQDEGNLHHKRLRWPAGCSGEILIENEAMVTFRMLLPPQL